MEYIELRTDMHTTLQSRAHSVVISCQYIQPHTFENLLQCVAVCCSVLQCVAVCRYVMTRYGVLQCVAVRCSVLQCVV